MAATVGALPTIDPGNRGHHPFHDDGLHLLFQSPGLALRLFEAALRSRCPTN